MKLLLIAPLSLGLILVSCEKNDAPEASVVVEENGQVVAEVDMGTSGEQLAEAIEEAEEEVEAAAEENPTPGERLDRAIEATGRGLQTAGEKTEQGVETAVEKTEHGVRTATEKTGQFLKKVGEKIERAAERSQDETE